MSLPALTPDSEILPLSSIRVETLLSKNPVHRLSRGKPVIAVASRKVGSKQLRSLPGFRLLPEFLFRPLPEAQ
jgi:hypothetical protein